MLRKQHNPFLWFLNTGKRFTQCSLSNATATNSLYLNLKSFFVIISNVKLIIIFNQSNICPQKL